MKSHRDTETQSKKTLFGDIGDATPASTVKGTLKAFRVIMKNLPAPVPTSKPLRLCGKPS